MESSDNVGSAFQDGFNLLELRNDDPFRSGVSSPLQHPLSPAPDHPSPPPPLRHRTYCLQQPFKLATSDLHSKSLEDTAFVFISSLPQCLVHCYLHNRWWKTTSWVEGRKARSKEPDESDESERWGWKEAEAKDTWVQRFSLPQKEWEMEDLVLL